jgi:23S rRNA (uracil1939-C5)-methyltransferase
MAKRKRLPVDPFPMHVDRLLENGRGGGQHEGRMLQVHDALPGESVMARYLFGRRMRGQAQAVEILQPSPDRAEPRCPHFGVCSACSLQHLQLAAQIAFKQEVMLGHLRDQGLRPAALLDPLQADCWHYRRKARLSVRYVAAKGRVLVGFRERDGRCVADMREFHIVPRSINAALEGLSELLNSLDAREQIPQIEITCGDEHCALVFRHLQELTPGDSQKLIGFARATRLAVLLQAAGPDSVQALWPEAPRLAYRLPDFGLEYVFEPRDFIQVNAALNKRMLAQALGLLQLQAQDRVLDLFCGLGNFTLPIAQGCDRVCGIEGEAGLVRRARENARRNGVGNVDYLHADLYAESPALGLPAGPWSKVLLDPPRSGAGRVLDAIGSSGAGRVLYVSCNPVTMAQDGAALVARHGYELAAAGVMDMFPHTAHVESMALFTKEQKT